jgi:hypothetical protein
MSQANSPPDWEEFRREMRALEARVERIEERLELPAASPTAVPMEAAAEPATIALAAGAGAIPILGRTLLGMAGAYLLRAVTESRALPQPVGVFLGIVYAMAWLVWAARIGAGRRVEAGLYGLTSALVLASLLWEATLRFQAISTWTTAIVLFLFTLFGLAISWHRNLLLVATIATLTGVLAATALLIASHDVLPFTFLLLAIAAAVEASACLDHWLSERWLTAAAADLAVLLATYLVTNARGLPEVYAPISRDALLGAQMGLLVLYLASTIVRTLLRGFTFTTFETAQLAVALWLAVGGGLRVSGANPEGAAAMAAVCLACAAACYWVCLGMLGRRGDYSRNFHTYGAFGFLLATAGSLILLSGPAASAIWGAFAILFLASRGATAHWHGCLYLLAGLVLSGALAQATALLLGSAPEHNIPGAVFWPGAAGVVCYALAVWREPAGRLLRVLLAGAAFWILGAVLAAALALAYHAGFGASASHAYCATLRTVVLVAGALLSAWTVDRWRWTELRPIVYLVMCLGAYRLFAMDLGQDRKAALVFSLLGYGATLMILPRWMHAAGQSKTAL